MVGLILSTEIIIVTGAVRAMTRKGRARHQEAFIEIVARVGGQKRHENKRHGPTIHTVTRSTGADAMEYGSGP